MMRWSCLGGSGGGIRCKKVNYHLPCHTPSNRRGKRRYQGLQPDTHVLGGLTLNPEALKKYQVWNVS